MKQAGKVWYNYLNHILLDIMNFIRCPDDPCMYLWYVDNHNYLLLDLHVDDGLMGCTSIEMINNFMEGMNKNLKNTTLYNPIKRFLGIDITRDLESGHIYLSQEAYISTFNMYTVDTTPKIPMSNTINIKDGLYNELLPNLLPFCGKIRYVLDRCRPDALVAGSQLAGVATKPSDIANKCAKQCQNYLLHTKHMQLKLGGKSTGKYNQSFGIVDGSHICTNDARSRIGGALFGGPNSGAIFCFSRLLHSICHSSMEVEINAIDHMILVIINNRNIQNFIENKSEEYVRPPTIIFTDSKSGIELCKSLKNNNNIKHVNMRIQFIRACINARIIELRFIKGVDNVADMLTKNLPYILFNKFREILLHGYGGNIDYLLDSSQSILTMMTQLSINEQINSFKK